MFKRGSFKKLTLKTGECITRVIKNRLVPRILRAWESVTRFAKNKFVTHSATLILGCVGTWYVEGSKTSCNEIERNISKIKVAHDEIQECKGSLLARLDSMNVRLTQLKNMGILSTALYDDFMYTREEIIWETCKFDGIFQSDDAISYSRYRSFFFPNELLWMNDVLVAQYKQDRALTQQIVDTTNNKVNRISSVLLALQEKRLRYDDKIRVALRVDIDQCRNALTKIKGTVDLAASTKSKGRGEAEDRIKSLGDRGTLRTQTIFDSVFARGNNPKSSKSDDAVDRRSVATSDSVFARGNNPEGVHLTDRTDLPITSKNDVVNAQSSTKTGIEIQPSEPNNADNGLGNSDHKKAIQLLGRTLGPELMAITWKRDVQVLNLELQKQTVARQLQYVEAREDSSNRRVKEDKKFYESLYRRN